MAQLTAITKEQFVGKAWTGAGYAFAQKERLIPVVMAELNLLVPVMPIVFVPLDDSFQLMGLTAIQPGSNLYISPDGQWLGDYVPAIMRAYPFQIGKTTEPYDSLLCFDTGSGRLVDAGQGEPFFAADGALTQSVTAIMNMLMEVEGSRIATHQAVDALHAAGLIQHWNLTVKDGDKSIEVQGLFRIDETILNTLPDDTFLHLRQSGALGLAYAHLLSLNQIKQFGKLVQVQQQLISQRAVNSFVPALDLSNISVGFYNDGSLKL